MREGKERSEKPENAGVVEDLSGMIREGWKSVLL
jgi:hypothetical protein